MQRLKIIFKNGYTLVEILVVMSVMALLSGVLIAYNRTGEQQIVLFKEQAKVINTILRAKSLSISTYTKEGAPCGYGVHFDGTAKTYILFKEANPCSDNKYTGIDENFELNTLPATLNFSNLELADILFIPPEPKTIINGDPNQVGTFSVIISAVSGNSSKSVNVNNYGQITAE